MVKAKVSIFHSVVDLLAIVPHLVYKFAVLHIYLIF